MRIRPKNIVRELHWRRKSASAVPASKQRGSAATPDFTRSLGQRRLYGPRTRVMRTIAGGNF